jgi:hypothetical protein
LTCDFDRKIAINNFWGFDPALPAQAERRPLRRFKTRVERPLKELVPRAKRTSAAKVAKIKQDTCGTAESRALIQSNFSAVSEALYLEAKQRQRQQQQQIPFGDDNQKSNIKGKCNNKSNGKSRSLRLRRSQSARNDSAQDDKVGEGIGRHRKSNGNDKGNDKGNGQRISPLRVAR